MQISFKDDLLLFAGLLAAFYGGEKIWEKIWNNKFFF